MFGQGQLDSGLLGNILPIYTIDNYHGVTFQYHGPQVGLSDSLVAQWPIDPFLATSFYLLCY